ncbi:hypothetical protein ACWGS9_17880 [Bradyrhizobium sp. Arg314]
MTSRALTPKVRAVIDAMEQFQQKCVAVGLGDLAVAFRPELHQNKEIERFAVSVKR